MYLFRRLELKLLMLKKYNNIKYLKNIEIIKLKNEKEDNLRKIDTKIYNKYNLLFKKKFTNYICYYETNNFDYH